MTQLRFDAGVARYTRSGGGGPPAADEKVKVTIADTTAGFLGSKIAAGASITLGVLNPGANEQLQIGVTPAPLNPNACTPSGVLTLGLNACAENLQSVASGIASHAEGAASTTGAPQFAFGVVPNTVTIAIVGIDARPWFAVGISVRIQPTSPAAGANVTRTVATPPAWDGVQTTFDISAVIDTTTDGGWIVNSDTAALAFGRGAHAEGVQTTARGASSHSEGGGTEAHGPASHAEGAYCKAYGDDSHAEGEFTQAIGIDSHAEGGVNEAWGFCAHAEGGSGIESPTFRTIASGEASHTEGWTTRAGNIPRAFTVAAGGTTITIAGNVVAEFQNGDRIPFRVLVPTPLRTILRTITSVPVFAAGNTTFSIDSALDAYSTGGDCVDTQFGLTAHAEGSNTIATGASAHAQGQGTTASGRQSFAGGLNSVASGDYSVAVGDTCTASAARAWAGGQNATASGISSLAIGNAVQATQLGAVAFGSGCLANAAQAMAVGSSCTASGQHAFSCGASNVASGTNSFAAGDTNTASGIQATCIGVLNTASGQASFAHGAQAKASAFSEHAFSGGQFAAVGDNQTRRLQLRASTPGAAPGETAVMGPNAAVVTLTLEAGKSYQMTLKAMATRMGLGAAARQSAAYFRIWEVDVTTGGVITVNGAADVVAPIITGAGFVGATLPITAVGLNLFVTWTIGGALTVASRITGLLEVVEVLGN